MIARCATALGAAGTALLLAAPARAEDASGALASPTIEPLIRMVLALAAIGVAAWAIGAWARKRRVDRNGTDYKIEVLAMRSIGPRQRLALIEVAERRLLVGIGADSIRPIAELSDPLSFAAVLDPSENAEPAPEILGAIGRFEGLDG